MYRAACSNFQAVKPKHKVQAAAYSDSFSSVCCLVLCVILWYLYFILSDLATLLIVHMLRTHRDNKIFNTNRTFMTLEIFQLL